jgi:hypothetical protein
VRNAKRFFADRDVAFFPGVAFATAQEAFFVAVVAFGAIVRPTSGGDTFDSGRPDVVGRDYSPSSRKSSPSS